MFRILVTERERERKRFCTLACLSVRLFFMNFVLACFVLHLCLHTVPVSSALEFPFRDNEFHCVACIHELDFSSTPRRTKRKTHLSVDLHLNFMDISQPCFSTIEYSSVQFHLFGFHSAFVI